MLDLRRAALNGDTVSVKRFLNAGEDVNGFEEGGTPLMTAARNAQAKVVKLLLEAGADVHVKSKDGSTAKPQLCYDWPPKRGPVHPGCAFRGRGKRK